MMATHDYILAGLASLPPEKLKEAQARLKVLLASGSSDTPDNEDGDRLMVYNELCDLVRKKTGEKPAPLNRLLKTRFRHPFLSGADEVIRFAKEHLKPKSRTELNQAVRLLVGLIVTQVIIEGKFSRLSIGMLCCHLGRVAELVDDAFPGYVACGVIGKILKPHTLSA